MIIGGLQKLSLLDYPEKTCATVFTGGCNFRCPYCHNPSLIYKIPQEQVISEESFFDFLKKRQGLLDGVCISGGEPLTQQDLESFIYKVKELGFLIKLDTNGSYPDKIRKLIDKDLLDYLAMDIKNSPHKYGQTIGIENFDISPISESIALLLEGHISFEFRTTLVKEYHEAKDILAISQWIKGAKKYYLQNYLASGKLASKNLSPFAKEELLLLLELVRQSLPNTELRGI